MMMMIGTSIMILFCYILVHDVSKKRKKSPRHDLFDQGLCILLRHEILPHLTLTISRSSLLFSH